MCSRERAGRTTTSILPWRSTSQQCDRQGRRPQQEGSGAAGGARGVGADGLLRHANVALFVPHNGCPHQCSFCNQRSITGSRPSRRRTMCVQRPLPPCGASPVQDKRRSPSLAGALRRLSGAIWFPFWKRRRRLSKKAAFPGFGFLPGPMRSVMISLHCSRNTA